jgi:hypothetical protein
MNVSCTGLPKPPAAYHPPFTRSSVFTIVALLFQRKRSGECVATFFFLRERVRHDFGRVCELFTLSGAGKNSIIELVNS